MNNRYQYGDLTRDLYKASLRARELLAYVQSVTPPDQRAKQKLVRAERFERQFRRGNRHA